MKNLFRKHGKLIMGLLSIVLMFVFALPSFQRPDPKAGERITIGYINGTKVIGSDLEWAKIQLDHMREMRTIQAAQVAWWTVQQNAAEGDQPLYWILLKNEARKYQASVFDEKSAKDVADESGLNTGSMGMKEVAEIFSDVFTVHDYLLFVRNQPRPASLLELQADRELRKVQTWLLTLDAQNGWQQAAEPSDAQIQAHFNAYKGVVRTSIPAPGTPATLPPADKEGHHYPFGYKYPDQVEVEYVVFDWAAIEKLVIARDDAQQKLRDLTNAHNVFSTPAYKDKKWDDVKADLLKAQVAKRVETRIGRMTEAFRDRASKAAAGGSADYTQMVKELGKTSEFMGYEPPVKRTGLMDAEALGNVEGIGKSWYSFTSRGRDYPFSKLAVTVPELVKVEDKDPLWVLREKMRIGVEGPGLVDEAKNQYVYRVTKAVPTHEPASIDEGSIRKQVIEDLKKLDTHKKNLERAEALSKSLGGGDMQALADKEKLAVTKPAEITRLSKAVFDQAANPDRLSTWVQEAMSYGASYEAARDAARKQLEIAKTEIKFKELSEGLSINGFTEAAFQIADRMTGSEKTSGKLEDQATLRSYVLQVQKVTPATGEEFAMQRFMLMGNQPPEEQAFWTNYLSQSALETRMHWKKK